MKTWAVIPSNGRDFLYECLDAISPQVHGVIVVANGNAPKTISDFKSNVLVVKDHNDDMNISRWWNKGLDVVSGIAGIHDQWDVLVLNDDVIVPHNFVEFIGSAMRSCSAAIAYPNQHDSHRAFWREPGPVNLFWRITGYAFMMRGELGLRFDEQLVWWYGDDDIDWQARTKGGSYLVPGCPVEHRAPNGTMNAIPSLHVQAGHDRQTFINKWGKAPW